jgi:SWI/SNF related-matrix-associated actin-dependent regulator of chromatin subfamily C
MEKLFLNPEFSREISLLKHPIPQLQGTTSQEICKFLLALAKGKFDLKSQIPCKLLRTSFYLSEIIKFYEGKVTINTLEKIYNHLLSKDFIKLKMIAISPIIKQKLKKTLGLIESSLEKIDMPLSESQATHVLYPVKINSENSSEWYRTVDKKYGLKIIHYWYTPDSKDVFVQDSEEFPEPEGMDEHSGPWHLSVNWLLDSIKYSEWMNESDYEIGEQEIINLKQEYDKMTQEELDLKDEEFNSLDSMLMDDIEFHEDEEMGYLSEKEKQGSDASFNQSEEEDSEDEEEEEDDDDSDFMLGGKEDVADDKSGSEELNSEAQSLSAFVNSKPVNIKKELQLYTLVDLERKAPARYKKQGYDPIEDGQWLNISHSVLELDSWIGNNRKRSERKWFAPEQEFSESDKSIILKVLNSSAIFSGFKEIDDIHPIESDAFPSFCGKDATYVNRQVFKDIRNAMILAYATDPYSELTLTECYKHLRYDIHDLATIHNFLSHFNFINTQVSFEN